ncbi:MAG TPA: FtsX-like permease family protein [Cryptosporangiaceae bacterium]|nr:FtsX-like permease family protein [Cryptosporangiaceae bacterium]
MLRATLKSLLSRKLRLTLSALAVVLGVMFVSGAFVLTDSLGKSFDALFATVNDNVDVRVSAKPNLDGGDGVNAPGTVPAAVLDTVSKADGVKSAYPAVFADGARVIGKNGKVAAGFGPKFGQSWNEGSISEIRDGRAPAAPNEIAVDAGLAKAAGLSVGDQVGVLTLKPKKTFTLVGIFGYPGNRDSLGGEQSVAFTMPVAQELMLAEKDVYTEINLVADDGVTPEQLRDQVKAAVGDRYLVQTAAEAAEAQASDIQEALSFFTYILLGFAGVALFVGVFLILNTFSMLVAQRTRELALMRAMGASRGQVINSVLIEAVVIGLVASVLGLGAGIGVGALLAWVFGNTGGGNLDIAVSVPLSAVVASFGVGLLVTMVAAMLPAVRASRIPPVAAMRDSETPDKPLTFVTVAGAVVTAAGAGLLGWGLAGAGDATLWLILGGVLLAFIGVALLTPIVSRPIVSLLGLAMSWSVPGKLGRRNSARNPRRTAVTAAALMVGIALVTGISTVAASAKTSVSGAVDKTVQADLVIAGAQTGPVPPTFDAGVVEATKDLPGVRTVAAFYYEAGKVGDEQTFVAAVNDLGAAKQILGLQIGGTNSLSAGQLVVDADTAQERKLEPGSTVAVQLSRGGSTTYTVAGVYQKNELLSGYILAEDAVKNFRIAAPAQGYVQLDDGADAAAVKRQVETLLKDSPEVTVQDRSAFVAQQTSGIDQVLVFIQVLLALAIVIAVLGIVNTLALSVIERTRELGLLRAIGLRRSQTMRMVTVEAVVISVFGALLGVAVGIGLGAAVVRALRDEGFSTLALPWTQMGVYLVLAAAVGVIAAVLPAIRAARLNVLNAIAYE